MNRRLPPESRDQDIDHGGRHDRERATVCLRGCWKRKKKTEVCNQLSAAGLHTYRSPPKHFSLISVAYNTMVSSFTQKSLRRVTLASKNLQHVGPRDASRSVSTSSAGSLHPQQRALLLQGTDLYRVCKDANPRSLQREAFSSFSTLMLLLHAISG